MPGWIPGNVDLGDPLVAFQAIHDALPIYGTEQDGELLVRFARFTPFAFEHGHHSGLRRHDDMARRVLAETGAAVPAVLKLRLARNELPNTNELCTIVSDRRLGGEQTRKEQCDPFQHASLRSQNSFTQ